MANKHNPTNPSAQASPDTGMQPNRGDWLKQKSEAKAAKLQERSSAMAANPNRSDTPIRETEQTLFGI